MKEPLKRPIAPLPPPAPPRPDSSPVQATPPVPTSPPVVVETAEPGGERCHPIPPPSHPRQYRAIGLVKGCYENTDSETFTRGTLTTPEGSVLDAVLLGRTFSLIKKYLDLQSEHLWVVYPRTRSKEKNLHVQIVGVWEPETLASDTPEQQAMEVEAGYFSVRGQVIFYDEETEKVVVKIRQSPRNDSEKPKFFKIELKGKLPSEQPLNHFWDLKATLEDQILVLTQAIDVGVVRPKVKKGGRSKSDCNSRSGPTRGHRPHSDKPVKRIARDPESTAGVSPSRERPSRPTLKPAKSTELGS